MEKERQTEDNVEMTLKELNEIELEGSLKLSSYKDYFIMPDEIARMLVEFRPEDHHLIALYVLSRTDKEVKLDYKEE